MSSSWTGVQTCAPPIYSRDCTEPAYGCVPKSEPRRSGTSHRVWSAWNVLSRDEGSLAPTRDRKEGSWWALTGSNRRPSRCKRDALPTELSAPPDVEIGRAHV